MGKPLLAAILTCVCIFAHAKPYRPADDAQVLAELPSGSRHADLTVRTLARDRIDVALPLAKIYIANARDNGDLRLLGYAESTLAPWIATPVRYPRALILHASILQSRHDFMGALEELDNALSLAPDDAQAWLIRSTVLRVLGRYDEALKSCGKVARNGAAVAGKICQFGIRALTGDLPAAYSELANLPMQTASPAEKAWRHSELGEMAVRLGRDAEAESWFKSGLHVAPRDLYMRAAYADLLLRQDRPREVLSLLEGREAVEPLLLRIAIAQKTLGESGFASSRDRLAAAFAAETRRGEGIHRREEARYFLDVESRPGPALSAAVENWYMQRETDDLLVLVRSAGAANRPEAAQPALDFVREQGLQDVRLALLTDGWQ